MNLNNKAVIGIKRTYHNDQFLGYRLRAAIPNSDGYKFKPRVNKNRERIFVLKEKGVTSFKAPYLILEGSDLPFLTSADVERMLNALQQLGYSQFDFEPDVIEIARSEFSMAA